MYWNWKKKAAALVLVTAMLTVCVPFSAFARVSAASFITSSIEASGSSYTKSAAFAAKLDAVFAGDVGFYTDSSFTQTYPAAVGDVVPTKKTFYLKSNDYGNVIFGSQCYIFGNAVYNALFNELPYHGDSDYKNSEVVMRGGNTVSYERFAAAKVKCGAYGRTTVNTDGSYSSAGGHSFIVLAYDENGISFLEGNGDGAGLVRIANRTWAEFNKSLLSGKNRYLSHIVQPTDSYFTSHYGSAHPLTITSQPQNVTANEGSPVRLSVQADGSGTLRYQWYYKKAGASAWSKWNNHTDPDVSVTAVMSWNGMQLYCAVTDDSGNTVNSAVAVVTVKSALAITVQPQDVTANAGDTVTFRVQASGSGLGYQWYYKKTGASAWSVWKNHNTASTSAAANATWDGMQVYCKVTDGSGNAVNSRAASITLESLLAITAQPANVTAQVGDNVKFKVSASGSGLRYQWYYKKAGASAWSLWKNHTTAVTYAAANAGWNGMQVYCAVTDDTGRTVHSNAAKITMDIPFVITAQPEDVTVKAGNNVKFTVGATGGALRYQWYYKKAGATVWSKWNNHTTATTSATANATWNGMQVYCRVTDGSGNTLDSAAARITLG